MKRSRAFILAEQLLTIMLQAGFILVLCGTFYQLTSFYANVNQVLTARNHAERVISFVDDKIRHAGLGLWNCTDSATIRARMSKIKQLSTLTESGKKKGYKLPIALTWFKDGINTIPQVSDDSQRKYTGDVLILLYAQKDMSSDGNEIVMTFRVREPFNYATKKAKIKMIDFSDTGKKRFTENSRFATAKDKKKVFETNIEMWAVAESVGIPFCLLGNGNDKLEYPEIYINFYDDSNHALPEKLDIPDAGELLYLTCNQMFVHDINDGNGRQFAFREVFSQGTKWYGNGYNQEKGILEIYMTLDTTTNIFTLYVLASGGENQGVSYPRPESWPPDAHPTAEEWESNSESNPYKDYKHHIVYVSRASWKLNNIPPNFRWN